MLGKNPIKWRQRPDMTIAVDWDVKHQFKQTIDSNQVQHKPACNSQKQARSLKFRTEEEEGLYYPCSENKDADQLYSYCKADLRLCFRIGKNLNFS